MFHRTTKAQIRGRKWSRSVVSDSLWTVAYQASPSRGFSRQEYWSGLPFPSPGYLPDPGIKPRSPALEADALTSEPPGKPLEAKIDNKKKKKSNLKKIKNLKN